MAAATLAIASTADAVPEGFQREYFYGPGTETNHLVYPTNLEFAPDGSTRFFVTEKRGVIKTATAPGSPMSIVADMRDVTHSFWDRGMLGLAIHPDYPDTPYIYVLYTHGTPLSVPGGPSVEWEGPGPDEDACPNPPGSTGDGCVVSAKLSRLQLNPDTVQVVDQDDLITDWCQQFPSHSIGDLVFGADGALYVSAGDGASFNGTDYGQFGGSTGSPTPRNPCGDPPSGAGGVMSPATSEGGALRAQSLLRADGPAVPNGSILRINPLADPDDPASLVVPGNPNASHPDAVGKLIVAQGLRNPYRMTVRPDTSQIYIADVGYNTWEEVNRILNPTAGVLNFGWPCYEGGSDASLVLSSYATVGMCEDLINAGPTAVTAPFFAYRHNRDIEHPNNDDCPPAETGQMSRTSSSTTGLAFYPGGTYPGEYNGALFGADYSRGCIWVMFAGQNGQPNPASVQVFHYEPTVGPTPGITPVDLEMGPDGRIYGVSHLKGHIFRFAWNGANDAPVADIEVVETDNPFERTLDGTGSSDPNGHPITYAWDLDNDGLFDDSTEPSVTTTFDPGQHTVRLRVTDFPGASGIAEATFQVNNTEPVANITSPTGSFTWAVGDQVQFAGTAADVEDGTLPPNQMQWNLILHHCAEDGSCHEHHELGSRTGLSGSFDAPDHPYPSWLEIRLTVEDQFGATDTDSVVIQPKTIDLTIASQPSGLDFGVDSTPYAKEVIVNSLVTLAAPQSVTSGGQPLVFSHWLHGGNRVHDLNAPTTDTTYTAVYVPAQAGDGVALVDMATGRWTLRDPQDGPITTFLFGRPGDHPILGDWDCDGIQTPGVYRRSDGMVYLRNSLSAGNAHVVFKLGRPEDFPLAGDFDGDDCDTVSVYRPSEARIFVVNELGILGQPLYAEHSYYFGTSNDRPFVGDFDGNGIDEVAMHRESTGTVYIRYSLSSGFADATFIFGRAGDRVLAGLWDPIEADHDTVGVYRPSAGILYLKHQNSAGPADLAIPFGGSAVWPVAGYFGP